MFRSGGASILKRSLFAVACLCVLVLVPVAGGSHTPAPASVGLPGSFGDELGCPGDWQPDCSATQLAFDAEDGVWQGAFDVPAGSWEYKAALNGSWDENYGAHAQQDGANIALTLNNPTSVKFYYDHATHWITDNHSSVIATAPGSYQSELGCPGDWQPDCLRSWLEDPDGDGIYEFRTSAIPPGDYEVKAAINESWDVNYGAGGVQNGPNIPFTVAPGGDPVLFSYDSSTHVLTVSQSAPPQPNSVGIPGSFGDELGCPGDWQPDCPATQLSFDASDRVWQGTFNVPAGDWEYKAALNGTWDENYGANAQLNGPNIGLSLAAPTAVKFYYDHATHWITDNHNSVIATAPGSYQSEIGCPGDWQPDCLRSWLEDPDGDGIYRFSTSAIPPGDYEAKAAINESWDVNYGDGGIQNGANIPFTVAPGGMPVVFSLRLAVARPDGLAGAKRRRQPQAREGALADARHARLGSRLPSAQGRRTTSTTRATAAYRGRERHHWRRDDRPHAGGAEPGAEGEVPTPVRSARVRGRLVRPRARSRCAAGPVGRVGRRC